MSVCKAQCLAHSRCSAGGDSFPNLCGWWGSLRRWAWAGLVGPLISHSPRMPLETTAKLLQPLLTGDE